MNEMSTSMMAGMAVHFIACLLLFFAVVSAIVWMARFASKAELKKAFWTCLVVGVLGCIVSCLLVGPNMMKGWDYDDEEYEDMEDRMEDMMDSEDDMMQSTSEATETEEQ